MKPASGIFVAKIPAVAVAAACLPWPSFLDLRLGAGHCTLQKAL